MDTKDRQIQDITWRYFNGLKNSGEDATFSIHRFRNERPLEKLTYDHRRYDGVSAICEILRTSKIETFIAPQFKVSPCPSFIKQLSLLLVWSIQLWPGLGKKWRTGNGVRMPAQSFVKLTKEEWMKVQSNKGGSTGTILAAVDKVAQKYYQPSFLPRLWMIPVGLYEKVDLTLAPQNKVAFVDVKLTGEGNQAENINSQIKRDLSKGLYWGGLLTLNIVRILGDKLFAWSLKTMHYYFRRTGTITNIGKWDIPSLSNEEWWAVQVTTVRVSPVGVGLLEINGQLSLSFHFHPSLRWTPQDAQKIAMEVKSELLS